MLIQEVYSSHARTATVAGVRVTVAGVVVAGAVVAHAYEYINSAILRLTYYHPAFTRNINERTNNNNNNSNNNNNNSNNNQYLSKHIIFN